MTTAAPGSDVSRFGMAPWARRRARWVQAGLVGGSAVLGVAFLAMLGGTASAAFGAVLAAAIVLAGGLAAWWLGRTVAGVSLEVGPDGVRYVSGRTRIEAGWADVAAVDLVLRGTDTGPALVLHEGRSATGAGRLAMGGLGGSGAGAAGASPSVRSTIPLAAFIEGRFVGGPVEGCLRRHVPQLVDGFVLRHPERVR